MLKIGVRGSVHPLCLPYFHTDRTVIYLVDSVEERLL